ncbi:MAG: DNA cytosine methyltransferase, partial [Planctomycetaceae bacterium]|nr:DNA cytosine methyltransferase [Planctomycetaceae bacterium]
MAKEFRIPVVDLFAGPGGLGEGFSAFDDPGYRPFKIGISIEKDAFAHQTLRLRSFYRQFPKGETPSAYYDVLREEGGWLRLPDQFTDDPGLRKAWESANREAMLAELGPASHDTIRERISDALGRKKTRGPWVLIGGPPCQAYSLVGRSRNKGIKDYTIESDARSKLYEEYLRIIAEHRPTIFVMENVTGMLSATVEKKKIFETILSDLHCPAGKDSNLRYR